jgi:hypothetical protein
MALIGINAVGHKPADKEEVSVWDKVLKGLQLAQSGFGIAVDFSKLKTLSAERTKIERQGQGIYTTGEVAELKGALVPRSAPPVQSESPAFRAPQASGLTPQKFSPGGALKGDGLVTPTPFSKDAAPSPAKFEGLTPRKLKIQNGENQVQEFDFYPQEEVNKRNDTVSSFWERAEKVSRHYDNDNRAAAGIFQLAKKGFNKTTGQFDLLSGTDDYQLLKAFNQFNDTPRVTEGEMAVVSTAQGLFDQAKAALEGWKKGDKLGPELRAKMIATSKELYQASLGAQKEVLLPIFEGATRQQLPLKEVFRPGQLQFLQGEVNLDGAVPNARKTADAPAMDPGELSGDEKYKLYLKRKGLK